MCAANVYAALLATNTLIVVHTINPLAAVGAVNMRVVLQTSGACGKHNSFLGERKQENSISFAMNDFEVVQPKVINDFMT